MRRVVRAEYFQLRSVRHAHDCGLGVHRGDVCFLRDEKGPAIGRPHCALVVNLTVPWWRMSSVTTEEPTCCRQIRGAARYLHTSSRYAALATSDRRESGSRALGGARSRTHADTRHRLEARRFNAMTTQRQTVSIGKACELVDVSRRTLYRWIASGKVEYIRTVTGSTRIFVDTLWRTPKDTAVSRSHRRR